MDKLPVRHDGGPARRALDVDGPTHTGVLPGLKVMADRATGWKFAWQQSPLAACPQEVKDGVEDGTKFGGARSPTRSRRRQNWRNPGPRRVGQVGVVESRVHRTVPLARISALSRQTSTFQTPSKTTQGRAGTRSNAPVRVAFRYANSVGTLNNLKLSRLDGWPAGSPVNASSRTSRYVTHDLGPAWGPAWLAMSLLLRTFTFYSLRSLLAH